MMKKIGPWATAETKGVEVGQHWAYRLARSGHEVAEVAARRIGVKRPPRVLVDFIDDDWEGRSDWVPPVRLVARWGEHHAWVEFERNWNAVCRASSEPLPGVAERDVLFEAVRDVFASVDSIAAAVSWRDFGAAAGVLVVHDCGLFSAEELAKAAGVSTFVHRNADLCVPWLGGPLLARSMAARRDA